MHWLPSHLESRYGSRVAQLTELDLGVFRVDRRDGPSWVARVFPAARPLEEVQGDAAILRFAAQHDFPAERCAHPVRISSTALTSRVALPAILWGSTIRSGLALGSLAGWDHH